MQTPNPQLFGLGPTVFHPPVAVGLALGEMPVEHLGTETSLLSDRYDLWRETVPTIRERVHAALFREAELLKEQLAAHLEEFRGAVDIASALLALSKRRQH